MNKEIRCKETDVRRREDNRTLMSILIMGITSQEQEEETKQQPEVQEELDSKEEEEDPGTMSIETHEMSNKLRTNITTNV